MSYRTGPRFDDFRSMTARRDSTGCVNGANHEIKRGDYIGWSRRHRVACCADCWRRWEAENAEAEYLEANPGACPW
jgi:hypothetical protein